MTRTLRCLLMTQSGHVSRYVGTSSGERHGTRRYVPVVLHAYHDPAVPLSLVSRKPPPAPVYSSIRLSPVELLNAAAGWWPIMK